MPINNPYVYVTYQSLSSYKNKTTRRFKHCEEAWRVLVGVKVVLFIESTKLLDGKLFFERRFCCFSISYERAVHNRFPLCTRTRQQISPNKLGRCHRCQRHRCQRFWGWCMRKGGRRRGCVIGLKRCCHRHCEGFLLLGEGKNFPWAGRKIWGER